MALPVLVQHLARTKLGAFCARRIPAHAAGEVRLDIEFGDSHVTLVESRPDARTPGAWLHLPVARFRYNGASGTWTLLSPAFSGKESWRPFPAPPTRELERLIIAVDEDQSGIFWG